jgi:aminopeptidase N
MEWSPYPAPVRVRAIPALLVVGALAAACGTGGNGGADSDAGATTPPGGTSPAPSDAPSNRSDGTSTPSSVPPTTTTTSTTVPLVGRVGADVGDPYFPSLGNTGIDALHYDLEVVYDPVTTRLDGVVGIDVAAEIDLAAFDLDLVGLHVAAVAVDGVPASFEVTADEIQIELASAVPAGSGMHVQVTYGGVMAPAASPSQEFELGWIPRPWGAYVAAEPDGARNWFPADDHPTDKATYSLAVVVPATATVAATGLLTGVQDVPGDRRRWSFEARDPTASYLVSVAVGEFTLTAPAPAGTGSDPVLRHALAPETAGSEALGQTAAMIDFLEGLFGPYPFEAYGVVAVPEDLGYALENQTLTLIGQDFLEDPDFAPVVLLHEVAHQWAGDDVSVERWADIWLSEGFATYAEWMWQEHTGGPSVQVSAAGAHDEASSGRLAPPLDPGPDAMFGRTVYVRGALALHALRQAVGDQVFSAITLAWFQRHGGGSASTADFLALVTELGGPAAAATVESWLTAPEVPPL